MQIFRDEKTLCEDEDMYVVQSEITENDNIILRQAFLLAKSVPRQSNRTKWRERSGFQPNLLQESVESVGSRCLSSGDMVFSRGLENELLFLVVQSNAVLNGETPSVQACEARKELKMNVPLEKLLLDKGLVAVVPSTLFVMPEEGDVIFDEVVNEMIQYLSNELNEMESHSDDDLSILLSIPSTSSQKRDHDVEDVKIGSNFSPVPKIKKLIVTQETNHPSIDPQLPIVIPTNNLFYVIGLKGKKHNIHHYIAQTDSSKNVGEYFWMTFLRRTNTPGEFCWSSSQTSLGLVSGDEVIQPLSNPSNALTSSSRARKLIFKLEEINPFLSTLQ